MLAARRWSGNSLLPVSTDGRVAGKDILLEAYLRPLSGIKPDLQADNLRRQDQRTDQVKETSGPVEQYATYGKDGGGQRRNSSWAMRCQFEKRMIPHTTTQLM
jgi:succinate dehydrogenase/fumarate reductase flavoprotein subunit